MRLLDHYKADLKRDLQALGMTGDAFATHTRFAHGDRIARTKVVPLRYDLKGYMKYRFTFRSRPDGCRYVYGWVEFSDFWGDEVITPIWISRRGMMGSYYEAVKARLGIPPTWPPHLYPIAPSSQPPPPPTSLQP